MQELQPQKAAPQPAAVADPSAGQPAETAQHSAGPRQTSTVRAAAGAEDGAAEADQAQLRSEGGQADVQGGAEQQEVEGQEQGQRAVQGSWEQQEGEGCGRTVGEREAEDRAGEGGEGDGDDLSDMLEAELASGGEQEASEDAPPHHAPQAGPTNLAPATFATRCKTHVCQCVRACL